MRRTLLPALLLLVSLVPPGALASSDPAWLVTPRSRAPTGEVTEGSGSILRKGDRYYVATASHVSQGGAIELWQGSTKLDILGRLSDDFHDVEIIEVKKPSGSFTDDEILAVRDEKTRQFWVQRDLHLMKGQYLPAGDEAIVPLRQAIRNNPKEWRPLDYLSSSLPGEGNKAFDGQVQSTIGGGEMSSRMRISPGMSGSSLIGRPADRSFHAYQKDGRLFFAQYTIQGVATRFLCDYDRSYFTKAEIISDLIDKYESGVTGHVDATTWKRKGGVAFRDLGDGTLEANLASVTAGGGGSTDGGGNARPNPCDDPAIYQGMVWKEKPTVAFKLTPKVAGTGRAVVLYANLAAVDFIRKNQDFYEVQPVHEGTPIISLLKDKVFAYSDRFFLDYRTLPRSVFCGRKHWDSANDLLEYRGDHLRASLTGCGGEQIYFELDQNGALVGSGNSKFQPVIRVRARSSGQLYTIDLRNLFFTDLAMNYQATWEKNVDVRQAVEEAYGRTFLGIRDRESGREQFLELGKKRPEEMIIKLWPVGNGSSQYMRVLEIKRPCP